MNPDLLKFSEEDLLKALAVVRDRSKARPAPNVNFYSSEFQNKFASLVLQCEEHLDSIKIHEEKEDADHYIYESVMEIIYGNEVWAYIDKL